jgi:carboxylesterase type B
MTGLATPHVQSVEDARPIVQTTGGPVRGMRTGPDVAAFRGIRYAAPRSGPAGSCRRDPLRPGREAEELAETISATWLSFARDGVPRVPAGPEWPAHRPYTRSTMALRTPVSFEPLPDPVNDETPRRRPADWLRGRAL